MQRASKYRKPRNFKSFIVESASTNADRDSFTDSVTGDKSTYQSSTDCTTYVSANTATIYSSNLITYESTDIEGPNSGTHITPNDQESHTQAILYTYCFAYESTKFQSNEETNTIPN